MAGTSSSSRKRWVETFFKKKNAFIHSLKSLLHSLSVPGPGLVVDKQLLPSQERTDCWKKCVKKRGGLFRVAVGC